MGKAERRSSKKKSTLCSSTLTYHKCDIALSVDGGSFAERGQLQRGVLRSAIVYGAEALTAYFHHLAGLSDG